MTEKRLLSGLLGIDLLETSKGHAITRVTVSEEFKNIHGVAHGGLIFALADEAFAAACNFEAPPSVAVNVDISYFAPAKVGEILTAEASETRRGKTIGFYDVMVTNQDGKTIAKMRGISYSHGNRKD